MPRATPLPPYSASRPHLPRLRQRRPARERSVVSARHSPLPPIRTHPTPTYTHNAAHPHPLTKTHTLRAILLILTLSIPSTLTPNLTDNQPTMAQTYEMSQADMDDADEAAAFEQEQFHAAAACAAAQAPRPHVQFQPVEMDTSDEPRQAKRCGDQPLTPDPKAHRPTEIITTPKGSAIRFGGGEDEHGSLNTHTRRIMFGASNFNTTNAQYYTVCAELGEGITLSMIARGEASGIMDAIADSFEEDDGAQAICNAYSQSSLEGGAAPTISEFADTFLRKAIARPEIGPAYTLVNKRPVPTLVIMTLAIPAVTWLVRQGQLEAGRFSLTFFTEEDYKQHLVLITPSLDNTSIQGISSMSQEAKAAFDTSGTLGPSYNPMFEKRKAESMRLKAAVTTLKVLSKDINLIDISDSVAGKMGLRAHTLSSYSRAEEGSDEYIEGVHAGSFSFMVSPLEGEFEINTKFIPSDAECIVSVDEQAIMGRTTLLIHPYRPTYYHPPNAIVNLSPHLHTHPLAHRSNTFLWGSYEPLTSRTSLAHHANSSYRLKIHV